MWGPQASERSLLNQLVVGFYATRLNMKLLPIFDFVHVAEVRRAVVPAGDIREDVAFQNDINGLLARLDGKNPPLTALDWVREPVTTSASALARVA